jgi:hypothetical protein
MASDLIEIGRAEAITVEGSVRCIPTERREKGSYALPTPLPAAVLAVKPDSGTSERYATREEFEQSCRSWI